MKFEQLTEAISYRFQLPNCCRYCSCIRDTQVQKCVQGISSMSTYTGKLEKQTEITSRGFVKDNSLVGIQWTRYLNFSLLVQWTLSLSLGVWDLKQTAMASEPRSEEKSNTISQDKSLRMIPMPWTPGNWTQKKRWSWSALQKAAPEQSYRIK